MRATQRKRDKAKKKERKVGRSVFIGWVQN